jgi:hypothetical protein
MAFTGDASTDMLWSMSYKTLEVELENGRVHPSGSEALPTKAHALLTILSQAVSAASKSSRSPAAGLTRFLSQPDFSLTAAQFRESMESDFWEE